MNDSLDPYAGLTPQNSQSATDVSALNGLMFSPDQRWGMFAAGNYGTGNKRGEDAYRFHSYGITIGLDYRFTDHFTAGMAAGAYQARTDIDDSGSTAKLNNTSVCAYGTYKRDSLYVDGRFGYGWNQYDNDRKILFPGISRSAHSDPKGSQIEGNGSIGYEVLFGRLRAIPSLSLQYVKYRVDSSVESGADALNLSVDGQTLDSFQGKVGGRIAYALKTGTVSVTPSLWGFYAHEFGDEQAATTVRLAIGGDSCTITANAAPRRNIFQAGTGIAALGPAGISAYINYNVHFDLTDYLYHSFGAGIRWEF